MPCQCLYSEQNYNRRRVADPVGFGGDGVVPSLSASNQTHLSNADYDTLFPRPIVWVFQAETRSLTILRIPMKSCWVVSTSGKNPEVLVDESVARVPHHVRS